jgi:type VI secretion system protein ImpC
LKLPQGSFTFRSLDDFEPAALSRHVQADPPPPAPAPAAPPPKPPDARSVIDSLLGEATPAQKSAPPPPPATRDFMSGLIDEALKGTVMYSGKEKAKTFDAASAVRGVLREPAFRQLEAAWRGLYHLVRATDTDAGLKLKFFDGRREELATAVEQACQPAADPMGLIVADFAFGPSDEDVAALYPLAKQLAAGACVLAAGWAGGKEGTAWSVFRRIDPARYLALVGPRVLGRRPYTEADGAPFAEVTKPEDAGEFLWVNPAYHFGAVVAECIARTGWVGELHGSRITDLPAFTYKDEDGEPVLRCPVEQALDERRERDLAAAGVLTVVHARNSDQALLPVARSVQTPAQPADETLAAASAVMARIPFVLAAGRFVHAARASGMGADELNAWLSDYVSAYGPLLDGQAAKRDGRLELYLQPWLGREELPGAVAVPV